MMSSFYMLKNYSGNKSLPIGFCLDPCNELKYILRPLLSLSERQIHSSSSTETLQLSRKEVVSENCTDVFITDATFKYSQNDAYLRPDEASAS